MNDLIKADDFKIIKMNAAEIQDMIGKNLGNDRISHADLDIIKVPSGESVAFNVPTRRGIKPMESISGIIFHHADTRVRWDKPFDQRDKHDKPACKSNDTITGIGSPGGACATCPHAEYDKETGRQQCTVNRWLYMIQEGSILPIVVKCAPTSVTTIRRYFIGLVKDMVPVESVITELSLDGRETDSGQPYSVIIPTEVGMLDEAAAESMAKYAEFMIPLLARTNSSEPIMNDAETSVAEILAEGDDEIPY